MVCAPRVRCFPCLFPSLNPLRPHGITELAQQESDLQTAIPIGMSLEQVRGVLNLKKIQFYESTEPSDGVILQNQQTTITAQAGDTVVVSRFQTEAFEFPCGYDMQIVLLFGKITISRNAILTVFGCVLDETR